MSLGKTAARHLNAAFRCQLDYEQAVKVKDRMRHKRLKEQFLGFADIAAAHPLPKREPTEGFPSAEGSPDRQA